MDKDCLEMNTELEALRLEKKALSRRVAQLETIIERSRVTQAAKANVSKILAEDRSRLEKYMKLILNNSPEIILLFDKYNRFAYSTEVFIQKARLRNFGLIENKTFREVFSNLIDEENLNTIEKEFNAALSLKLPVFFEADLSIEANELRKYKVYFTPMLDEGDEIEGAMALFHDMTDIIDAKEQALSASRAKTNFLANMSHEMRTPLNVIMGMTNIASSTDDVARKDYCFDKITSASAHLLSVINDILDMSKIETDKYELTDGIFNLEKAIAKAISAIKFQVEEKNQEFSLNLSPALPPEIYTDEQRLIQVITNLLSNAVKFTNSNGCIELSAVKLSEEEGRATIEFKVKDNGIGISSEQQKNLFRSFEQADGSISRRFGGTGLGLALSKNIIEKMGGTINVCSEPNRGSVFTFTINVKTGNSYTSAECGQDKFVGKRVLVVEDIEINREIVETLLTELGVNVDFAVNGIEALNKFSGYCEKKICNYDMILMDIHMPEMDGYEATRRIRALGYPCAQTVPIVAMTANVFREDIERCINAGMNAHVGKPLDFNEVTCVLRKYLT